MNGRTYFDNAPIGAVTSADVETYIAVEGHVRSCGVCELRLFRKFLPLLLQHPGVSSTARAVIEAMLGTDERGERGAA